MRQKPLSENQKRKLKSFYVCDECGRAFKSKVTHENGLGLAHCGAASGWTFEKGDNLKNKTYIVDVQITKITNETRKIKAANLEEAQEKAEEFNRELKSDGMGNSYGCEVFGIEEQ